MATIIRGLIKILERCLCLVGGHDWESAGTAQRVHWPAESKYCKRCGKTWSNF